MPVGYAYLGMSPPISLINDDHRHPKGASGGHKVSASRAAQASEARLYIYVYERERH